MTKPRLPRSVSQAWPGGFVFNQARTITRVAAGAVEPRRPARFAVAGMDAVLVFDGARVDRVRLHAHEDEVCELAWARSDVGTALALYALLTDGTVLRIDPGTGEIGCA
jgi:hypothetical protein